MSAPYLLTTYAPLPITFERGEGCYLFDTAGNAYLDAASGIAVCSLGHSHPQITKAITEQAGKLLHTSNLYRIANSENLAALLCQHSGMQEVFFANSGAEANECALKLIRLYGHQKGIAKPKAITMNKSFHGRSIATISASGNPKIQAGFEPLIDDYIHVPFNDVAAVEKALADNPDVVAIMLEPLQGEGGIRIASPGYLKALRKLCDKHDCLLIIDEIQTGIGRTGAFFAYQHEDILPDIVTSAKALGNGVPIGACLASQRAIGLMKAGMHGSTFGGNPFAAKVAQTVIEVLEKDNLINRAAKLGETILGKLREELADNTHVVDIRGKGLMIGIELDKPCREIMNVGLAHGILFNVTADNVIRILPPYILTDEQAQIVVDKLVAVIEAYTGEVHERD